MTIEKKTIVSKDAANRKITVLRAFDAPLEQVWKAWTEPQLLDQWWAPKPWKAHTTSMEFRDGGVWRYYMEGPDGTRHFCRVDFKSIEQNKSYEGTDAFCNEAGEIDPSFPTMDWHCHFSALHENATQVRVEISFATESDMNKIIEMGFEEGFTAAHGNLDDVLAATK